MYFFVATLRGRARERPDLLKDPRHVGDGPIFNDLAAADAVDHHAIRFDFLVRRRYSEEFSFMNAPPYDVADH
jgi:hypothetical protein